LPIGRAGQGRAGQGVDINKKLLSNLKNLAVC